MQPANKEVKVTRMPLDKADQTQLKSTTNNGLIFVGLFAALAVLFFVIADNNDFGWWVKGIAIVAGLISAIIGGYIIVRSKKDLKKGEKVVTKGLIWDVVEEFETKITVGKNSKSDGTRKYIFKLGEIEHCFYRYAHSYIFTQEDEKYDSRQEQYHVGDLISMHHNLSGSLIRISIDKQAKVPKDKDFSIHLITCIKHKIHSNRPILNYYPRRMDLDVYHYEECYYFHVEDDLVRVEKEIFEKYPSETPIKIMKDEHGELTSFVFIENEMGRWDELQTV